MINILSSAVLEFRQGFLETVRAYFREHRFLEVQTPLKNPWETPEPFLQPYHVTSYTPGSNPQSLVTSPEFNLKTLWAHHRQDLFEIAHCFRSGESGDFHTAEFLMLEWYHDAREEECIQFIHGLIARLLEWRSEFRAEPNPGPPVLGRYDLKYLFRRHLGVSLDFQELWTACRKRGHFAHDEDAPVRRYEEYFFTLFLNHIETEFQAEELVILEGYPAELAAYSSLDENNSARRFEVYWKGLELANAYYELTDPGEQRRRMKEESDLKAALLPTDATHLGLPSQFLEAMEHPGMPSGCGVALGIERLMMAVGGYSRLGDISPFPGRQSAPE